MTTETATAQPTKKLFIDTLVRDVDLTSAIVDLVDNCIDGAKRIRPDEDFTGLGVAIVLNSALFRVSDNCGGIPLQQAKNYAFRFGREDGQAGVGHSVGHFGVGMKRTLFKMAEKFSVKSVTHEDSFELNLNVDAWKRDEQNWSLELERVEQLQRPDNNRVVGTVVQVAALRPEISEQLEDELFVASVRERVRLAHTQAIRNGLTITFNDEVLESFDLTIKESSLIRPRVQVGTLHSGKQNGVVRFRMITGVADQATPDAGWYVFCNGRLLLAANQEEETGWGFKPAQKFHQQFNRFRGYLFLDADDPGSLPWNTTKTGMSADSDVYRRLRPMMSDAISEVTTFLNRVREEEEQKGNSSILRTPLLDAISAATLVDVSSPTKFQASTPKFVWPQTERRSTPVPTERRINYVVPIDQFEAACEVMRTHNAAEVGRRTFEYWFELNAGADE